jgi:selenide,water dikinase
VLRHVPHVDDPRVLVDALTRDDAAVFKLSENRAIVVSVDFFAPIVDDPWAFGAIAGANAFSDLYAMGATPLLALNLVAWPRDPDILQLLGETLDGGLAAATAAGAFVLGGHSIDDKEPKYGMVVVGEVEPNRVISLRGAMPGDVLVLTKPLGTGILSTALKRDLIVEADMRQAIDVMAELNAGAAKAMRELGIAVHAATDVTGFGLLGHLRNMLEASGQAARISLRQVPRLDGVADLLTRDSVPGGTERNLEAANEMTAWADGISREDRLLVCDAQTSGGMLIAVERSKAADLIAELERHNTPVAAAVGEVIARRETLIEVTD